MRFYDVELHKEADVVKASRFIESNGGIITDTFIHNGAGIYLLRVRMSVALADDLRHWKAIKSVEDPPKLKPQLTRSYQQTP